MRGSSSKIRECGSKALVVFMPTANNDPGERMLSIPTTALLDTLTAPVHS